MAKRVPLFETDRLTCYALTVEDYASFASGIEPIWSGFTNPHRHLIEGPSPMVHRIPRVAASPEFAEIAIILAVLKASNEVIGSAGFHDLPDAQGMIEIGLELIYEMSVEEFLSQPYAFHN